MRLASLSSFIFHPAVVCCFLVPWLVLWPPCAVVVVRYVTVCRLHFAASSLSSHPGKTEEQKKAEAEEKEKEEAERSGRKVLRATIGCTEDVSLPWLPGVFVCFCFCSLCLSLLSVCCPVLSGTHTNMSFPQGQNLLKLDRVPYSEHLVAE